MRSSVPPDLYESMAKSNDLFLYSKDTLYDYRNVLGFHVPDGQNHIPEPVHAIFGVEIGRWLADSPETEAPAQQ